MKSFPIPVVTLGPGSQPDEEPLQYIAAPGEMAVFRPPTPRATVSAAAVAGARAQLERLLDLMEQRRPGDLTVRLSLLGADPAIVAEVNELLGHGEVSARVAGTRPLQIQESAFAGIWRVQALREDGALASDDIEAGPIPDAIRTALGRTGPRREGPELASPGVMNAPAILHELAAASRDYRPGDEAHVVNLTLLPVTPEDLEYLAAELGGGPVTILSRGYGNCRISATALPHTWWVQYFNSMDQLILNTLEVVEVPVVALAADEDLEDSATRLREWIATL
jgi:hydrogenase-1 operon protein HyaF